MRHPELDEFVERRSAEGGAAHEGLRLAALEAIRDAGETPPLLKKILTEILANKDNILLACANPEYTPGATGELAGSDECPGPHPAGAKTFTQLVRPDLRPRALDHVSIARIAEHSGLRRRR